MLARVSLLSLCALALSPLSGCLTDLGECDEVAARQVVFLDTGTNVDSENGEPMYAGQALLSATCGSGQFCHGASATGPARYGVPRGLDFDFGIVCTNGPCIPFDPAIERLHRSQKKVLSHASLVLDVVRSGSMPPGPVGQDVIRRAPGFRQVSLAPGAVFSLRDQTFACADLPPGTCEDGQLEATIENPLLPALGTHEGDEILRNWIACGAPVVESTGEPGASATGGDCGIPGEQGHTGTCVVRIPAPIDPPEQTWTSIYATVIGPRCGQSCHTPSDSTNFDRSQLDLSNQLIAYQSLFEREAGGQECDGMGTLIVPGSPDDSLLIQKMERTQGCGDPMPTGTSAIDPRVTAVIRAWISAGAPNN
jgi:hypothetical protein